MDDRLQAAAERKTGTSSVASGSHAVLSLGTVTVDPTLHAVRLGTADPQICVVQRALIVAGALRAAAVLAHQAAAALDGRQAADAHPGIGAKRRFPAAVRRLRTAGD